MQQRRESNMRNLALFPQSIHIIVHLTHAKGDLLVNLVIVIDEKRAGEVGVLIVLAPFRACNSRVVVRTVAFVFDTADILHATLLIFRVAVCYARRARTYGRRTCTPHSPGLK